MITLKRHSKKPFVQELVMHFPVFSNFKVTVILCEQPVIGGRYIADRDYLQEPPSYINETEAFTSSSMNGYATIHLKPNAAIGTIAHEAYHAVVGMMKFVGATHENEVIAYHLGYIVDKIAEFNLKVAPRFERNKKHEMRKMRSRKLPVA